MGTSMRQACTSFLGRLLLDMEDACKSCVISEILGPIVIFSSTNVASCGGRNRHWLALTVASSCRAYPNVQNLFSELQIQDRLQASCFSCRLYPAMSSLFDLRGQPLCRARSAEGQSPCNLAHQL